MTLAPDMRGRRLPTRGRGSARRAALLVLAIAAAMLAAAARSEVVDLVFAEDGHFEHRFELAAGKFAELCGRLGAGQVIGWSWQADGAVDFNIHFHVGKDLRYPARQAQRLAAQGELVADTAQDYCWMWTNRSAHGVRLQVKLQRR